MIDLSKQKCKPCSGEEEGLSESELKKYLPEVPEWEHRTKDEAELLFRTVSFENFEEAVAVINDIAAVAESENHHPNLYLHDYNQLDIEVYTHKIQALHLNDFILAKKIDLLLK